ncbi:MAG: glycosyltransferase family 39 protein [Lachnospiraceae bacterium]|nr:glycosyltransferase family 39 protein [Lachnospiraceae bacterium]
MKAFGREKIHIRPQVLAVLIFLALVAVSAVILGEDKMVIAVQDDLDLFQAEYADLRNTGTFFSQGAVSSELGGVTRDAMPTELSLTALIYMIFPPFPAYIAVYILKVLISVFSFGLLSCELYGYGDKTAGAGLSAGFLYGILNLFPAYGIAFASVPLAVYFFIRLVNTGRKRYLLCLFLYPFVSYLSYLGLFILMWAFVFWVILSVRRRKPELKMLAGVICLGAGYVCFEYRLVRLTVTGPESIRSLFTWPDMSLVEALGESLDVFLKGQMHSDAAVTFFVLPLCAIYLIYIIFRKMRPSGGGPEEGISGRNFPGGSGEDHTDEKASGKYLTAESVFLVSAAMIAVNSVIYGMQDIKAVRDLVWGIFPFMSSLQFDRAVFLNPFLWYLAFLSVMLSVRREAVRNLMAALAALMILLHPGTYNDILNTAKQQALEVLTEKEGGSLTYGEFYDTEMFCAIREDLGYNGEWCVCYGLYPAELNYNGFRTLDGYLGFYPLEYKERFREVIKPALDMNPWAREYYDGWGARCVLFSGTGQNIWSGERRFDIEDSNIYIDTEALKAMDCRWLFSRYRLENAEETGLYGERVYSGKAPYSVYVYGLDPGDED